MKDTEQIKYDIAKRQIHKIKGFYRHLTVYIIINSFIVILNISNLDSGESYFHWKNFLTLFFWGIGLFIHGFCVFAFPQLLGRDWEERKIKEFMEKDKQGVNKFQKWE